MRKIWLLFARGMYKVAGYATPNNKPRCIVFLLDLYFSKLPKYAFVKDVFYLRLKTQWSQIAHVHWYDCVPVGKNKLSTMVKDICNESRISDKTNHTLRVTGATKLMLQRR